MQDKENNTLKVACELHTIREMLQSCLDIKGSEAFNAACRENEALVQIMCLLEEKIDEAVELVEHMHDELNPETIEA